MKNILLILLGALLVNNLSAQIYFDNPSFEGGYGTTLSVPWKACSESPDILPFPGSGDLALPLVGDSYIGIVSIGDWFVESFSQTLDTVLLPHQDYYFSIYANAMSKDTTVPTEFHFSVWVGSDSCTQQQKIYTSPDIPYLSGWIEYVINFTPSDTINTILFSSDTLENNNIPGIYIGLDNLSPIYEGYQPPLSTPIVQAAATITISPNPSTGLYHINQSSDAPLLVYDINGQLLQHYAPHTAQIDLSHLTAGLYILSIGTDKQCLIKF